MSYNFLFQIKFHYNFVYNWFFDFCIVYSPALSWSVFSVFDVRDHGVKIVSKI